MESVHSSSQQQAPVIFVAPQDLPDRVQRALDTLRRQGVCQVASAADLREASTTIWLWTRRPQQRQRRDVIVYDGRPPRWTTQWLQEPGTAMLRVADNDADQRRLLRQLAGLSATPETEG